jgi:hypothetical protein
MAAELGLNVKLQKSWTITRYWKSTRCRKRLTTRIIVCNGRKYGEKEDVMLSELTTMK